MIKLENTVLSSIEQWEAIIKGMRNPKNSWGRIDSGSGCEKVTGSHELCNECNFNPNWCGNREEFVIGPNDHQLMMDLANGGPVHAKYRRMIPVYVDITAPLYWWKEFDTYRTGVTPNPMDIEMNSCSTMHKIHDKEFTLEDFSHEHLFEDESIPLLEDIVNTLNKARAYFLSIDKKIKEGKLTPDEKEECITRRKQMWWQMIQLLPSSYNQKRTIMLNYEALANMYEWRKNHKLDEWKEFCKWIEQLPYSEIITGVAKVKE
jgi:hypothetical protein